MKRLMFASALLASAIAANAALFLRPEPGVPTSEGVLGVEVGPRKLAVPRALMRDPAQMRPTRLDRLDLVLGMADFASLPPPDARTPEKSVPDRLGIVFTPADDGLTAIDMFGKVYARFLSGETAAGPSGLMLRRFREKTPYEDRALYLGVGTGRTFVALCPLGEAQESEPCTTSFRLAGLDMELRFAARHLPQWRRITESAFALAQMIVVDDQPEREKVPLPD